MVVLDSGQARALHLAAQGMLQPRATPATPAALRQCITRMGLLQIDTIHVVARSPYLVLFSRLGDYPPCWLDRALARTHLFETWAHEACFAPVRDLALHRSYNGAARRHWGLSSAKESHVGQRANLDRLLAHIKERGPVRSADFERTDDRRSGGWWGWKDEKLWLEALFARGELMVARRDKFQRVYDLAHRVCPQIEGMALPELLSVEQAFTERAVAALGVTQARWVHDYFRTKPRLKDLNLDALVDAGRLERVRVEGWEVPAYVHRANRRLLRQAQQGRLEANHSTLLSPFDPVVWDRERASAMFDFDYRIECYTPEARRVHGYFVLPVLHRGQLVARLDAKAHRSEGVFEVKALYLERSATADADLVHGLAQAITRCARWHATPEVRLVWTSPHRLAAALRRALRDTG
ncbi:MAG: crosslink repair DNA glycosylase YcaQ family protein [Burkholderiaceae bacterium]